MIKHVKFLVSIILIGMILLNGCDKDEATNTLKAKASPTATPTATAIPAAAINLTLRHSLVKDSSANRLKILKDIVTATENEVPNLHITLEGVDENSNRSSKLRNDMLSGNPPDIFELFGGEADAFTYARADKLLDLTPILNELEKQYDFASLQEFTVDGKVFGLPITGQVSGIFYNKKIFADLGVAPPVTYEAFLDICDKAQAKGITPLALAAGDAWVPTMLMHSLLVRTAGVEVLKGLTTGAAKWTDPAVVAAFTQYGALVTKGYFTENNGGLKYLEQQSQFKAGKAAMLYDGSWSYADYIDPKQSKIASDVGFFSLPDMGGAGDGWMNGSFNQGYGFSAQLSDVKKAAVKAFIKNMFNDDIQKRQLTEEGIFPAMFLLDNTGVPPLVTEIIAATKASAGTFDSLETLIQKNVLTVLKEGMQQLLEGETTAIPLTEKLQMVQVEANAEH
jgi:raffinose/stachyose/melibiose transport system substrate-binding protein